MKQRGRGDYEYGDYEYGVAWQGHLLCSLSGTHKGWGERQAPFLEGCLASILSWL